jgi:hypothetical protein
MDAGTVESTWSLEIAGQVAVKSELVELLRALQHSTVGARDERLGSKIVY